MKAFTTYNISTGAVVCSGYVSDDSTAAKQFAAGESVLVGVAADPATQMISVVGGVPTVVGK